MVLLLLPECYLHIIEKPQYHHWCLCNYIEYIHDRHILHCNNKLLVMNMHAVPIAVEVMYDICCSYAFLYTRQAHSPFHESMT